MNISGKPMRVYGFEGRQRQDVVARHSDGLTGAYEYGQECLWIGPRAAYGPQLNNAIQYFGARQPGARFAEARFLRVSCVSTSPLTVHAIFHSQQSLISLGSVEAP
jgi:hypothetical protein